MAKFICELEGVRGREMKLYDTKCVITTKKTVGSFITGNFTDGEKTIFYTDVVGVQYKRSGVLIGYLQLETSSSQMNNKSDNMFSENTFTFEGGKNGISNELMEAVYHYVVDRLEEIKYKTTIISEVPDFESMKIEYIPSNDESDKEDTDKQASCVCELCGKPTNKLVRRKVNDSVGFADMCKECAKNY